jgi:hypothetical protein
MVQQSKEANRVTGYDESNAAAMSSDPHANAERLSSRREHHSMAGRTRESLLPDRWQVLTLEDAYKPRPPVRYVVSGLFPLPSLSIVYGAPGTLKSMILLEMCACVAAGRPWLPPMPGRHDVVARKTMKNPVLWCDFDNGTRRTHERVEAVARGHNLPMDVPLSYVTMPSPWLDLNADARDLRESIQDVGAKLVVIDNLGVVSGGADENSIDMIHVLKNCRSVAEKAGAAVVLIHHQRKSNGFNGRAGESLRGHSSILAAIDLALLIEREEHAELVHMKSTKVRGNDVLPFGAQFTYKHRPGTEELAAVKFYGLPVEDLTSDAAIRRAVLDELDGQELNKGDLKAAVKERLPVGIGRIGEQIDKLASDAEISMNKGDRNAKLYSLPKEKD